jgi:uncharacterized protein (TIGR02246 family)
MKTPIIFIAFLFTVSVSSNAQSNWTRMSPVEAEVAALGRAYTDMIRRSDAAAIADILAEDYIVTDEIGKVLTKKQDLATYKNRAKSVKIEIVDYKDQRVRMITTDVAVEHSTIRFIGTKNGEPFDFVERITTTWAKRNGSWQIAADHFSYVKEEEKKFNNVKVDILQ